MFWWGLGLVGVMVLGMTAPVLLPVYQPGYGLLVGSVAFMVWLLLLMYWSLL